MATTRKFAINKIFYLFPKDILTDIDIWVSGIEHCNKFKAVITNINTMCKPTLFSIQQELWAPYQNLSVYSCWYNQGFYELAYRCITTNTCSRYQLLYSYYTVIIKLKQRHIEFHESVVAFQHITWDKNSSIPYFKQAIMDSCAVHHATRDTSTFRGWRPR